MPLKRSILLSRSVSRTGADAGAVLVGTSASNAGLRLRVARRQSGGSWGPITGRFEILDVGENMHSRTLESLLGRATDAAELSRLIRRDHPACINIVNANILTCEEP